MSKHEGFIKDKGLLVVISGFSGAGKSTLTKKLLADYDYGYSVSATTRTPREGEVDGKDYHFISREAFEKLLPEMLAGIYDAHSDTMKSVPVYLGISELGESGIRLKFCVDVEEKNIYSVQRILNRELLVAFRKAGVEVPYPQLDVHQR